MPVHICFRYIKNMLQTHNCPNCMYLNKDGPSLGDCNRAVFPCINIEVNDYNGRSDAGNYAEEPCNLSYHALGIHQICDPMN